MDETQSTRDGPDAPSDPQSQRDLSWWRRLARRFFKPISASVIIVDPDVALVAALKQDLENTYRVNVALSASAALQMLRADQPDILVSELHFSDMDGFTFLRTAKSLPGMARTSVLVLSTRSGMNDKVSAFRLGVDDFMVKPVTAPQLREHLDALVHFRQVLAARSTGPTE